MALTKYAGCIVGNNQTAETNTGSVVSGEAACAHIDSIEQAAEHLVSVKVLLVRTAKPYSRDHTNMSYLVRLGKSRNRVVSSWFLATSWRGTLAYLGSASSLYGRL